jgi:hypothetical protein
VIAPIRRPEARPAAPGVLYARRLVASTLLRQKTSPAGHGPPMPAWRAWLLAAWVVMVVAAYFASMVGLF